MPWKAALGADVIDLRGVTSTDRVAMHEEKPAFRCPGCDSPMTLRAHDPSVDIDPVRFRYFADRRGPFVAFAHYPGTAERCRDLGFHGDETLAHLGMKQSLCDAAQAKGWSAEVEVYHQLPTGERCRADVVVTREGEKTRVLEAQIAALGPDEAVRRSKLYREAFGDVLWTHTKQRPWSRRLPSLRVDDEDQDVIIGGVYDDTGCIEPASPASLLDTIGMVLPPAQDLTWIWVADDYGGFVRLGGARPPMRRRRPSKRQPSGEIRPAGAHVHECASRGPALGRDHATRLIAAWLAWDENPGWHSTAAEKLDAINAAGLNSCATHDHIAAYRRAGMSIPDAIQTIINDSITNEAT